MLHEGQIDLERVKAVTTEQVKAVIGDEESGGPTQYGTDQILHTAPLAPSTLGSTCF